MLVFVVLGTGIAAAALFDYRKLKDFWPFIYGLSVFMLSWCSYPASARGRRARRAGSSCRASAPIVELAKLAMIIGFAGLASQFRGDLTTTAS